MEPVLNIEDHHEGVRLNEHAVTQAGSDHQAVTDFYTKWGLKYDEQLTNYYPGPKNMTNVLVHHLAGKHEALILDIGCGTGLVAEKLAEHGYTNVEGLDPSKGMTDKARAKNLYKKIYDEYLTDDVPCLESDKYDVVVGCGVLATGHIPPAAMREVLRCLKPGGLAVFMTGAAFLKDGPVRQEINLIAKEGKWNMVECITAPFILEKDGCILVLNKSE